MIEHVKDSFAAMIAKADREVTVRHRTDAETLREHCASEHGVEPRIREREDGRFTVARTERSDA